MERPSALAPEAFERERTLGQGSFGIAELVSDVQSGHRFVLKHVSLAGMDEPQRLAAEGEVAVLTSLSHPNIIGCFGAFRRGPTLSIVLEYADAEDLAAVIDDTAKLGEQLPEARIMSWFCQIASALRYVHAARILHRDIKTSNVLMARGNGEIVAKLADFGIAKVLESGNSFAGTVIGSPHFMSPELVAGQ